MPRIFVAIPLPEALAQEVAALIPSDRPALRRVAPELLHFTLAFVGALAEERVPEVVAAAGKAAEEAQGFRVTFDAAGTFPPGGLPRVVWAGSRAAAAEIMVLGRGVREELRERALPFDARDLQPHVTLARVRDGTPAAEGRSIAELVSATRIPPGLGFDAQAVHVMESVLGPKGPRYSSRAEARLGTRRRSGPA